MGLLYLPLQAFRRIRSVLQDSQNQPGSQRWVHPRIHTSHIDLRRPTTPRPPQGRSLLASPNGLQGPRGGDSALRVRSSGRG